MRLSQQQIAKIQAKESQLTDALKRDASVDYCHGWFFVTLNTRDNVPVLSTCAGNIDIEDGQPGAPHCEYTDVGRGVIEAWKKMAEVCPTVEIDMCEAMPEHFHGLVHLLQDNKRHLGSLISGFMSGCTHAYWDTLGIQWRQSRDERIYAKSHLSKSAYAQRFNDRDHDHTHSNIGPALFVHGYNDVEALTPEQVDIKRAYIHDQARKRIIQGDRHDCFRKHRNAHSSHWTQERILGAIAADTYFHNNPDKCRIAQQNILARLNDGLDYLGSRNIMAAPRKLPLICHRADVWQFDKQKDAVLREARGGAIIVSAFISPKERDIRKQLVVEQLPFVEITDNGFSDRYKPIGKAFYALAENRLVQITPWRYEYQKDTHVTREMCMVMNELARVISGQPDNWWK